MNDSLSSLLGGGKKVKTDAEEVPVKPQWVVDSEKKSGVLYEWDPLRKGWRPQQGVVR